LGSVEPIPFEFDGRVLGKPPLLNAFGVATTGELLMSALGLTSKPKRGDPKPSGSVGLPTYLVDHLPGSRR